MLALKGNAVPFPLLPDVSCGPSQEGEGQHCEKAVSFEPSDQNWFCSICILFYNHFRTVDRFQGLLILTNYIFNSLVLSKYTWVLPSWWSNSNISRTNVTVYCAELCCNGSLTLANTPVLAITLSNTSTLTHDSEMQLFPNKKKTAKFVIVRQIWRTSDYLCYKRMQYWKQINFDIANFSFTTAAARD